MNPEQRAARRLPLAMLAACATILPNGNAGAQIILQPGSTTDIQPADARCITTAAYVKGPGPNPVDNPLQQSCVAGAEPGSRRARFYQNARNGLLGPGFHDPNEAEVDLRTKTGFHTAFSIEADPDQVPSLVPIQFSVPVSWRGILFNDSVIPPDPVITRTPAHATVNLILQLVDTDTSEVVASNAFHTVSHAGIKGCLTVPKSAASAAKMLISCVVATEESDEGEATVTLTTIARTGASYDIQLHAFGETYSFATEPPAGIAGFGGHPRLDYDGASGLTWSGPMRVRVGSDPAAQVSELQAQIDVLAANQLQLAAELERQQQAMVRLHRQGTGGGAIDAYSIAGLLVLLGLSGYLSRRRIALQLSRR